jgi:peptidoglycan/LPS O-acetylase OafA/YrhL
MENKRVAYLDGVRGIASLMVVISHIINCHWAWKIESKVSLLVFNGSDAVSLFFVLSGLVLSRKYLKDDRILTDFSIKSYTITRIFRLMPVYWVTIFVIYLYKHGQDIPSGLFFSDLLSNKFHLLHQMTLVRGWTEEICLPAWSLGVELVLSLLLPIFIFTHKINKQVFYFLIPMVLFANKGYISIFTFHFILGIILAEKMDLIQDRKIAFIEKYKWPILICSVLLFSYRQINILVPIFPASIQTTINDFIQFDTFFITGLGSFGILCLIIRSKKLKTWLENSLFTFLGKISYPMYLIHCFFIGIFLDSMAPIEQKFGGGLTFVFMTAFVLFCTFIASYLLHIFVENRFIRLAKKINPAK